MSNQKPDFLTRLRLEVQSPPAATDHVNLIANPTGATGAWGWESIRYDAARYDGSTLTKVTSNSAPALRFAAGSSTQNGSTRISSMLRSAAFPVTAGQQLRARITVPLVEYRATSGATYSTDGQYQLSFLYFDVAGVQVGADFAFFLTSASATPAEFAGKVPAGATQARIKLLPTRPGASDPYDPRMTFTNVAAVCEATDQGTGFVTSPAPAWVNVLTSTSTIAVDREPLGPGTLSATILDTSLDPVTSTLLRPGAPARLTCMTPAGVWEPLIVGTLGDPLADYDQQLLASNNPDRARAGTSITLTLTDALTTAANNSQGLAYGLGGLGLVVDAVGVPYEINGATDRPTPAPAPRAYNESASVADQMVITRDTETALNETTYVWVRRDGTILARTASTMPGLVTTLTTSIYTTAPASYALDRIINSVRVQVQSLVAVAAGKVYSFTGLDAEFGPYRNDASVTKVGAREATVTIAATGSDVDLAGAASTAARKMLASNSTPVRHVDSVTFAVRSNADLVATRALVDLYDLVTVTTPALTQTARVTGVQHRITPAGWLVTLTFDVPGSVPTPMTTPSATPTNTGSDIIPAGLAGAWVNIAGYQVAAYRRVGSRVNLTGVVKSGTGTIFTLPDGFQPAAREIFSASGSSAAARVDVNTDGTVTLVAGSGTSYLSLSGISFEAAT